MKPIKLTSLIKHLKMLSKELICRKGRISFLRFHSFMKMAKKIPLNQMKKRKMRHSSLFKVPMSLVNKLTSAKTHISSMIVLSVSQMA
jgi:hypothetical protein